MSRIQEEAKRCERWVQTLKRFPPVCAETAGCVNSKSRGGLAGTACGVQLTLLWRDRWRERGYQREQHPCLGTSAHPAPLMETEHAKVVLVVRITCPACHACIPVPTRASAQCRARIRSPAA